VLTPSIEVRRMIERRPTQSSMRLSDVSRIGCFLTRTSSPRRTAEPPVTVCLFRPRSPIISRRSRVLNRRGTEGTVKLIPTSYSAHRWFRLRTFFIDPDDGRCSLHVKICHTGATVTEQSCSRILAVDRFVGAVILFPARSVGKLVNSAALVAEKRVEQPTFPNRVNQFTSSKESYFAIRGVSIGSEKSLWVLRFVSPAGILSSLFPRSSSYGRLRSC
jgi:hypothetical protein